ncbi:MAG TPA: TetR/AcrR family transcriptional regulator [Acidimicrobiales bacterium]|nr:TetR/AcrR family transcriptional regulator [Acidimicrobiales bacterium]
MAVGRTTHLTRDEIVATALALLDENGGDFSMRALASRLKVSPAALYHHFDNQRDLVTAVVGKVWEEAIEEYLAAAQDPFGQGSDPTEMLVTGAICGRRAFNRHPRVAPYMAVAPGIDTRLSGGLAIFGSLMERFGLEGPAAGEAMYAYSTYVLGNILYTAQRRLNAERLGEPNALHGFSSVGARPADAPVPTGATTAAIDRAIAVTGTDAEEELFVAGLLGLLRGLLSTAGV